MSITGYVSQVKKCMKKKETKNIKLMFFLVKTQGLVSNYFRDQSGIGTVYIFLKMGSRLTHLSYDLTNFNPVKCFIICQCTYLCVTFFTSCVLTRKAFTCLVFKTLEKTEEKYKQKKRIEMIHLGIIKITSK